ncbi:hypothetical protein KW782_03165 [Candidatus Parcubacteria bacterium]|nr:hypothetical protein [Candidatus Parcubacteria bacterium]
MDPAFIIRFGVSLIMIVFGIHQILEPGHWLEYIPPWLEKLSPISPKADMRLHASGNIIFGLLFVSNIFPIAGGWIVLIWWLSILPFAFRKNWAIGMRDLTIILSIVAYLTLINI